MSVLSRVKESSRRALREARAAWDAYQTTRRDPFSAPAAAKALEALEVRLNQLKPGLKDSPLGSILQQKPLGHGAEATVYPIVRNNGDQPVLQVRKMIDPEGLTPAMSMQRKLDVMRSAQLPDGYRFAKPLSDVIQFPGKNQHFWNQEFAGGVPGHYRGPGLVEGTYGQRLWLGDLHQSNVRYLRKGDTVIVDPLITDLSREWTEQGMRAAWPFEAQVNRNGRLQRLHSSGKDELISMAFGRRSAGNHAPVVDSDNLSSLTFTPEQVAAAQGRKLESQTWDDLASKKVPRSTFAPASSVLRAETLGTAAIMPLLPGLIGGGFGVAAALQPREKSSSDQTTASESPNRQGAVLNSTLLGLGIAAQPLAAAMYNHAEKAEAESERRYSIARRTRTQEYMDANKALSDLMNANSSPDQILSARQRMFAAADALGPEKLVKTRPFNWRAAGLLTSAGSAGLGLGGATGLLGRFRKDPE